ncbi:MAG TPA: TRAP transporter small permease [Desulfobacteraceae bacterium]|nr:TRAP transporter small permease [Desulfobacteraceae bacterium]
MRKLSDLVNRAGELGVIFFVALLSVLVLIQVVFRYALDFPLFWTEETARYCLVWASLLGSGVALKRGEHIAVTYLVERLPMGFQRPVLVLSRIFVGVILAVVLWGGIQLVAVTHYQLSPALRIPMSVPYLSVPVGVSIMLIHLLASFFESGSEESSDRVFLR